MATKGSSTSKTTKKPITTTRKTTTASAKKSSPISREVWGVIYVILAVITLFSVLDFDGFVLSWIYQAVTFCIGFGIYTLPVSFFIMAIYCFVPFVGNVPLRSTCILSFPITLSCFFQVVLQGDKYSLNLDNIADLVETGMQCKSAGFLGGFISIILQASLSTVGAVIFLITIILVEIFIGFRVSPKQIYRAIVNLFNQLKNEDTEKYDKDVEYHLNRAEMKKAKKEKQKEYNEKLKLEKERAYEQYKKAIPDETLKKQKKVNLDINLGSTDEQISMLNELEKDARPEVEAWIVEAYEKIKERNEQERLARINGLKLDENGQVLTTEQNILQQLDKIDHIMEDLSEISLASEVETVVAAKTAQDISQILDTHITEETAELQAIDPAIAELEQTLDQSLEQSFEQFNPAEVKQAIEQSFDDDTREYVFSQEEVVPDLLKSTMKYEIASNFDAKSLGYRYSYPPMHLLKPKLKNAEFDPKVELAESSERLIDTLASFGVAAEIIHIVRGPSITRFEITISKGVKFSKITALSDDIALSLGAVNVRIAPIPDKVAIGIEVPNKTTEIVLIREVLDTPEFKNTTSKLSYALGHDITGSAAIGDIAKMPHMLIAGTTGSGKSVCVNSMLVSLLYKADPTEVKFIMIDPKMVELGGYNGIPHLLIPVVTDPKKAAGALNWAVGEMMKRYKLLAECNVKDLASYNMVMAERIKNGDEEAKKLPQIVIVIDELADLMMIAAKEVEESICRIAQMARAAGMHLVIATQRPSSDVITGIMKANIPSRISFAVSSQIESRIILDTTGAEKLIGKGDMLYNPLGASKPQRLQGCFITATEVESVVEYVKTIAKPDYSEEVLNHIESHAVNESSGSGGGDGDGSSDDPMVDEAIDIIVSTGQASTSFLQRKLRLGYARASRIIDEIEDRGIIGQADGSKPRQVLISKQQWQEMKIRKMD
ncbi:MAG: DNA translocase FtsK [Clostridia bacterium]